MKQNQEERIDEEQTLTNSLFSNVSIFGNESEVAEERRNASPPNSEFNFEIPKSASHWPSPPSICFSNSLIKDGSNSPQPFFSSFGKVSDSNSSSTSTCPDAASKTRIRIITHFKPIMNYFGENQEPKNERLEQTKNLGPFTESELNFLDFVGENNKKEKFWDEKLPSSSVFQSDIQNLTTPHDPDKVKLLKKLKKNKSKLRKFKKLIENVSNKLRSAEKENLQNKAALEEMRIKLNKKNKELQRKDKRMESKLQSFSDLQRQNEKEIVNSIAKMRQNNREMCSESERMHNKMMDELRRQGESKENFENMKKQMKKKLEEKAQKLTKNLEKKLETTEFELEHQRKKASELQNENLDLRNMNLEFKDIILEEMKTNQHLESRLKEFQTKNCHLEEQNMSLSKICSNLQENLKSKESDAQRAGQSDEFHEKMFKKLNEIDNKVGILQKRTEADLQKIFNAKKMEKEQEKQSLQKKEKDIQERLLSEIKKIVITADELTGNTSTSENTEILSFAGANILNEWISEKMSQKPTKGAFFSIANQKNASFTLKKVFKATKDGFSSRNFHQHCDNLGKPTLVLIVSNNGSIFGGFTTKSWHSDGNFVADKDAFVFSLFNSTKPERKPTKIPVKWPYNAIWCYGGVGPHFGYAIEICDHPKNSFNNRTDLRRKEYDIGDSYTDEESQCFLCGSFKFSVTEIEAYMIC